MGRTHGVKLPGSQGWVHPGDLRVQSPVKGGLGRAGALQLGREPAAPTHPPAGLGLESQGFFFFH